MLRFTLEQRGEFARALPFQIYVSLDFAEAKKDEYENEIKEFDPYDIDLLIYFLQHKNAPAQSQEEFERNLVFRGFSKELIASSLAKLATHELIMFEEGSYKINPSVFVKPSELKEISGDFKAIPEEHKATKKDKYKGIQLTTPKATNIKELIRCFNKLALAKEDAEYKYFFSRLENLNNLRFLVLAEKISCAEAKKIGRNIQLALKGIIIITQGLLASIAKIHPNLDPNTALGKIASMLNYIQNKWEANINISFSRPIDEINHRPLKRKEFYNMLDQFYAAINSMRDMIAIYGASLTPTSSSANPAAFFALKPPAPAEKKDTQELEAILKGEQIERKGESVGIVIR